MFAVILILLGAFTEPFLYLIGFFLLFPALLLPSNPKPSGTAPSQQQKPPRRISPPPPAPPSGRPAPEATMPQTPDLSMRQSSSVPQAPQVAMPLPMPGVNQASQPVYSQPLFPTNMFPSLTQYQMAPPMQEKTPQPERTMHAVSHAHEDELIELGALLALLKLAFG